MVVAAGARLGELLPAPPSNQNLSVAGCQDGDVLIVDDGMMRYLLGNWRSVATRVMRCVDTY